MDDVTTGPRPRRGVFPGSFNPLTVAHLEIARLAREHHELDEVHLTVSTVALDKPTPPGPPVAERVALIAADAAVHAWLSVHTTEAQLIVDIAVGYDVVIMGADKWEQVNDVRYYDDAVARDEAVAALPDVVVATRDGAVAPADHALATPHALRSMSSSAARAGDRSQMAPIARERWT
jgi:hypothetical protein